MSENKKCPKCNSSLSVSETYCREEMRVLTFYECSAAGCDFVINIPDEEYDENHDSNVIPFLTPEQKEVQKVIRVQALQNQVLNQEIESQKRVYRTKAELQSSYFHDLLEQGFKREEALQLVIEIFLGGAQ